MPNFKVIEQPFQLISNRITILVKDPGLNAPEFLDVSVSLQNEKLHTDLYCKPTDKHQYLYYTSCHPKHTKNSRLIAYVVVI